MKEPKFEIKPLEQKPFDKAQGKPESEPEIDPVRNRARAEGASPEDRGAATSSGVETWEGKGGAVEKSEKAVVEMPEIEKQIPIERWYKVMRKYSEELPDEIQEFLRRGTKKEGFGKLSEAEKTQLRDFRNEWWPEKFGISFQDWSKYRKKRQEEEKLKEIYENPETISGKAAFRIMDGAREEFANEIKHLLDKQLKKEKLTPEEQRELIKARTEWFQQRFGIVFEERRKLKKIKAAKEAVLKLEQRRQRRAEQYGPKKQKRTEELYQALQSLDNKEVVEQFRDETRRVVYYDEGTDKYFVEDNGKKKYLGLGDLMSDYAWGIKYVPDGEMVEPAYRTIAKRVLVNEARRDIEQIYDAELSGFGITRPISLKILLERGGSMSTRGFIAERMAREMLGRLSVNEGLNFLVLRANAVEDSILKYDFKLRVLNRNRGVTIENQPQKYEIKRVGIQFTIKKTSGGKTKQIKKARSILPKYKTVDDIVFVKITTNEFEDTFKRWLEAGKPSGGPEQFLSPELKKEILKAVTEKLVDIPQEVYDQIV